MRITITDAIASTLPNHRSDRWYSQRNHRSDSRYGQKNQFSIARMIGTLTYTSLSSVTGYCWRFSLQVRLCLSDIDILSMNIQNPLKLCTTLASDSAPVQF